VDRNAPHFPLVFKTISFRDNISNLIPPLLDCAPDGKSIRRTWYRMCCREINLHLSGIVTLPWETEAHGINAPIEQWPWILEHIAYRLETNAYVTCIMMKLLVETIKDYEERRGWETSFILSNKSMLSMYQAPKLFTYWEFPGSWRPFMDGILDLRA
jgi:hypothetical protein